MNNVRTRAVGQKERMRTEVATRPEQFSGLNLFIVLALLVACGPVLARPKPRSVTTTTAGDVGGLVLLGGVSRSNDKEVIVLTGDDLSLDDIEKIADDRADIEMSSDGWERISAAHKVVESYVEKGIPAYGFTTMFGQDFNVVLPQEEIKRFNRINVIQEATTLGDGSQPALDRGVARAAWALLVNSYAKGFSGVSRKLTEFLIARVNSNQIPDKIEDGGSMGDADLTMNCRLALSLYDLPGFELGAGEAMNLMSHNFITVARAALVVQRAEHLLAKSKVALALAMEGYRANPSPISEAATNSAAYVSKKKVQREMQFLLDGSQLWTPNGPRRLQDFLSMRDGADVIAAAEECLAGAEAAVREAANAHQGNPMVDVKQGRLASVSDFDTTELTLKIEALREAIGLMAVTSANRSLKVLSRPFTDLASGFTGEDKGGFDGLYTRNITYWLASLERDVRLFSTPVALSSISFVAEGVEDYSTPLPDSVALSERLLERSEKVVTIEALIGSFALERRIQKGQLTRKDVPVHVRDVHDEVIRHSPMNIAVDQQYSLGPLLEFFVMDYRPPEEILKAGAKWVRPNKPSERTR